MALIYGRVFDDNEPKAETVPEAVEPKAEADTKEKGAKPAKGGK